MTFRKFSKRAIVTSLFLGVVLASTVALASWLATGTGNGYAKARSAQLLTTNVVTPGGSGLYPGGTAEAYVSITNPNPYPVHVSSVAGIAGPSGKIVTTDANATCDASTGVTFTDQTSLNQLIGAGATVSLTFNNAVAMDNTSANACQGETFSIPVTITGTSG